jgi:hypothetical protein
VRHTWTGDLVVALSHQETGQSVAILDRPGVPASEIGCQYDHLISLFDDRASQPAENKCASYPAAISGAYRPVQPLSTFSGYSAAGTWTLSISDNYVADVGYLQRWCLEATLVDSLPPPTPTPTPVSLPPSARIWDISGQDQSLPLDCESRSAVDWAAYFGRPIGEIAFFNSLPPSDDPDSGFVGNVMGDWGQIPPDDYGVHAFPVAGVLRTYDLSAFAYRSLSWDELRAEVAAGRPVIVWIVGGPARPSSTASPLVHRRLERAHHHRRRLRAHRHRRRLHRNQRHRAQWRIYRQRPLNQFLDSWSALRNMGILAHER